MKTTNATLRLPVIASALLTLLPHAATFASDPGVTDADAIRKQVVEPRALTRSLSGPAKTTRSGFTFTHGAGAGTRSLAAVEVQVEAAARISLPNIQFKLGTAEPADATSRAQLEQLAAALQNLPAGAAFLIEGHTCSLGTDEVNNNLSTLRAEFVRSFLISRGVPAGAVEAIGCGAAEARQSRVTPDAGESRLAPFRKVMIHKKAS